MSNTQRVHGDARQLHAAARPIPAVNQLRGHVSDYNALSNEYAREDGRGAVHITRDTIHGGVSSENYLETTPMSPYNGAGSVRFMDGGLGGCSIDSLVVMGAGRSYSTLSMKGQCIGVESGRLEFPVPTGVIQLPISPYIEHKSLRFMDDAGRGYSLNYSLGRGVEEYDPTVSIKAQSMAMGSGKPELRVPIDAIQQPMSPYIGGMSVRSMHSALREYPVAHPAEMDIEGSNPPVSTRCESMGVGGGRAKLPVSPDASSTLFVEYLPAN